MQQRKNGRVFHRANDIDIKFSEGGDLEQAGDSTHVPDSFSCTEEEEFSNLALVTAQTKHFYRLDKKQLVGRHADEGGIWALRDLSIALKYGETFCLLGPNGAGKSTLISILSGILKSTDGLQFIGGQSLQSLDSHNNVHNVVGFCPQFDVVWDNLTGGCGGES